MQPIKTIWTTFVGDNLETFLLSLVKFPLAFQEKKSFAVFLI